MIAYNTFIIDNNSENLQSLKSLLVNYCPYLFIVGEYHSFAKALIEFEIRKPSIIFLDINYHSEQNHFVLNELLMSNVILIFTGKNSEGKMDIDWISQPYLVSETLYEINAIIKRKSVQLEAGFMTNFMKDNHEEANKDFFCVSSPDKIDLIHTENVVYCEADGKYTKLCLKGGRVILASKNIGVFEELLRKKNFYRIHQTYIVNVAYVTRVLKKDGATCELVDGTNIPIASRR